MPALEKGEGVAAMDGWLEGFLHGSAVVWSVLLVGILHRHASCHDLLAVGITPVAFESDGLGLSSGFWSWGWVPWGS